MGWASGSILMGEIIDAIKTNVKDKETRKRIYLEIIPAFENEDADTLDECMGDDKAFDKAYREINPEEDND